MSSGRVTLTHPKANSHVSHLCYGNFALSVGRAQTLIPLVLSHLSFTPATNPTAPPTFERYPEPNHFSPYLQLQLQAPNGVCLDSWKSFLADLLASPLTPCSVP